MESTRTEEGVVSTTNSSPIDPQIAAKFSLLDGFDSFTQLLADPDAMARFEAAMTAMVSPTSYVPPSCKVVAATAPGPHGPVPLRIYSAGDVNALRPGLLWAHGGAWMAGDLDMPEADMVARELCHRAGAVVVTVDYRLALGDVTYPVPLDDVVAAWRWVAENAQTLSIDVRQLMLGGASAGGNLAAAAALRIRDAGDEWPPARLLLAYPALHHPLPPTDAARGELLAQLPRLLRFLPEDMEMLVGNYLGEAEMTGYVMPSKAEVAGLAPTVIIASEYDDLRVSAEAFAQQLVDAGVRTSYHLELGVPHGHLSYSPEIAGTDRSLDVMAGFLKSADVERGGSL
jgi:acetyl esterase/lipase